MRKSASIRITYLLSRADTLGGAQIHVADLSRAMRDAGHDVSVVVGGTGPFLDLLHQRSIPVVPVDDLVQPISLKKDLKAFGALRRVLQDLRPDLISTHSSKAGLLGRVVGRSLRIPTLFTAHGWAMADAVSPAPRLVFGALEWMAAPLASRIVTVSLEDQELARRWRIRPKGGVVAVQNGVHDVDRELCSRPATDPARILMVARYEEPKDHAALLRALSSVDAPWASLDLVGSGPGEGFVRSLVTELGLSGRVRFHPIPSDVPALMAQAQLYVLISRREGLPRTIIEAMRTGLPVLASDVGGVSEVVDDGSSGMLVRPGDPTDLVEKLARLLREPDARQRLGRAGRERYERSFDFDRMARETMDVYEAVLGKGLLRPARACDRREESPLTGSVGPRRPVESV